MFKMSRLNTPSQFDEKNTDSTLRADDEGDRAQWVAALRRTVPGRHVLEYLSHIECIQSAPVGGVGLECPVDCCTTYRRVLVRALEQKQAPFGLPRKLPRFVAVVNLAGRRMLLTSDKPTLFQLMCHSVLGTGNGRDCAGGPVATSASAAAAAAAAAATAVVDAGVNKLFEYQERHPETTLLLTYAAPFQVEMNNLFWDLRTMVRTDDGKVVDGQLTYQIGQTSARSVAPTRAAESAIGDELLKRQIDKFGESMGAIDLDIDVVDDEPARTSLLEMITLLKTDRKKLIADHREELKSLDGEHRRTVAFHATSMAEQFKSERQDELTLNTKLDDVTKEAAALNVDLARLRKETAKARSEHAKRDLEWADEKSALRVQITQAEAALAASAKQTSKRNAEYEKEKRRIAQIHASTIDALEKKYQAAVLDVRQSKLGGEKLIDRMKSLSVAMEGTDASTEALKHQIEDGARKRRVRDGMLCLAGIRLSELRNELHEANEAEGRFRIKELSLAVEAERRVSAANAAAAEKVAAAELSLAELAESVKSAKSANGQGPDMRPSLIDQVEAGVQTAPFVSYADEQLAELSVKYVKLQEELDAKNSELSKTKSELTRTSRKANRRPPPVGCSYDEEQGTGQGPGQGHGQGHGQGPGQVPFIETGQVDLAVENTLQQANLALRVLADLARSSNKHKTAASDFCSQLRALQAFQAYQQPAQMQLQMPMYHPGF